MMHYLDLQNASFATAIVDEPGPHHLGYLKGREALEKLQKHQEAPDISTESFEVPGKCGSTNLTIVRSKSLAMKKLPMVFTLMVAAEYLVGKALLIWRVKTYH